MDTPISADIFVFKYGVYSDLEFETYADREMQSNLQKSTYIQVMNYLLLA